MNKFFKAIVVSMGLVVASCQGVPNAYAQTPAQKSFCSSFSSTIGIYHTSMKTRTMTYEEVRRSILSQPVEDEVDLAIMKMTLTGAEYAKASLNRTSKQVVDDVYSVCIENWKK